jgi:hypothetical protein
MTNTDEVPKRVGSSRPLLVVTFLAVVIGAAQLWVITAGWWWPSFPGSGNKYALLADAFAHGRLSLMETPPPALLAMADPYDPAANDAFRQTNNDTILYHGQFYYFWGPVPAILLAAAHVATGMDALAWKDTFLVMALMPAMTLLCVFLMFQMRRKLFSLRSASAACAPAISLGLGAPVLFILARPAVYEASITAGQFFLLAGFCAVWWRMTHPKSTGVWLVAAGICFALSMGSRMSLGPAAGAIAAITLWHVWREEHKFPLAAAAALILPLVVGAGLIGWYNFARFGSATEFGMRYQLSGHNQHAMLAGQLASAGYLLPNLLRYLFQPPIWSASFPYMTAPGSVPGVDSAFKLGDFFNFEPLVGLIWTQPFLLFAPLAFLRDRREPPERSFYRWLTMSLAAAAILGLAPALTLAGSTMRYLLDAVPCFTLLAALGYWQLLGRLGGQWRLAVNLIACMLVIGEAGVGLLLAITGYLRHFVNQNPQLYADMCRFFPTLK